MNKSRIYLSKAHTSGFEEQFVTNSSSSSWIDVRGTNITKFESKLENYLGKNIYVAALNSGTSALHLALILLNVKSGDEVICQSMTFSASAFPIIYCGATPVFVDSEPETWNICPIALEIALKDRIKKGIKPKAIIAVHLYGMPFKYDEIKKISHKYNVPLIEDAAEALGSEYKKRKCGTLGDINIFSFNGNKIITTSGGGALVTKNELIKQSAIKFATQSRDIAPHYQHSQIGYNYRMNNINAGIGLGQMMVIEKYIELRRSVNLFYQNYFKNINNVEMLHEPSADYYSNHWLTAIVLNSFEEREKLRLELEKENIETRPLWKPMHLQPFFEKYPYYGGDIAEELFLKGLCLPSSSNLNESEKKRISDELNRFFK